MYLRATSARIRASASRPRAAAVGNATIPADARKATKLALGGRRGEEHAQPVLRHVVLEARECVGHERHQRTHHRTRMTHDVPGPDERCALGGVDGEPAEYPRPHPRHSAGADDEVVTVVQ